MSFLKDLGEFIGDVTGTVVSTPVRIAAHITDSQFLHDSADAVYNTTLRSGRILGRAANGVIDVASGVITQDGDKLTEGGKDLVGAVGDVATGMIQGVKRVGVSVYEVGKGIVTEDMDMVLKGAKTLATVGITSVFAVGIADFVGVGVDGIVDATAVDFGISDIPDGVDLDHSIGDTIPVDTYTHSYFRHDGTFVDGYVSVHHDTLNFANLHIGDGEHQVAQNPEHPNTFAKVETTHSFIRNDGLKVGKYNSVHHEIPENV